MIAFTMAAITPTTPASTPKVLAMPPRVPGASDNTMPITPDTIATPASTRPKNAPTMKLKIAASTAMIEGILKAAP